MKPQITNVTTWLDTNGERETIERSLMRDFRTLSSRWASHAIEAMGEQRADAVLMPGVRAYSTTKYEEAHGWFDRCVEVEPSLAKGLLYTHLYLCRNLVATKLDEEDLAYLASLEGPRFAKWRRRKQLAKERCKWCGHYTTYVDPDWGDGWRGENTCERCEWNFPMPDFAWDSPDGLAYSFYRGSFKGDAFYEWFESMFEVNPGRRHYLAK